MRKFATILAALAVFCFSASQSYAFKVNFSEVVDFEIMSEVLAEAGSAVPELEVDVIPEYEESFIPGSIQKDLTSYDIRIRSTVCDSDNGDIVRIRIFLVNRDLYNVTVFYEEEIDDDIFMMIFNSKLDNHKFDCMRPHFINLVTFVYQVLEQ